MRKKFRDIVANVTDEDFETFMGDNVSKFSVTRQRMLDGKKTSWDWTVFFFATPWAINYRYHPVLNGYLVLLSAAIVMAAWEAGSVAGGVIFTLFASIFALRFKLGYVKSAYKKIHKIKNNHSERSEQLSEIAKAGKTFNFLTWQTLIVLALFVAYSAYQVSRDAELQQAIVEFISGSGE